MKLNICLILALFVSLKSLREYSNFHTIKLKDAESTIDNIELIEEPIYGVSYKEGSVYISDGGTFIISGELNGKLNIATDDKVVKLVLNGVNIQSETNSIAFEDGYELIDIVIDDDPYVIKKYDFNNAGAQIIIGDDSVNYLNGTEDGKQNGVLFSNITLHITGEEKGNGILYITSGKEGIEVYKHLCVSGGFINIASLDDGINSRTDRDSVLYIKGGKILTNAGIGDAGDGIDGNGYIVIDDGEIFCAAKPKSSSGLDSNDGTFINGGIVFAVGTSMDMAKKESNQSTMNLIFEESVNETSCISIKQKGNDTEIIRYNATEEEFINGTARRNFSAAIVSHPSFKADNIYHIYMNGELLGYTSNDKPGPGPRPGPGPVLPPGSHQLKDSEDKEVKIDFVLGPGATFYSGIQKYNIELYLKMSKSLFILFALMILNI